MSTISLSSCKPLFWVAGSVSKVLASLLLFCCLPARDSPILSCCGVPAVVGAGNVPDGNSQGTLVPTSMFLQRDSQAHLFHSSLHAEDRTASTQPSAWHEEWWLEWGRGLNMAV